MELKRRVLDPGLSQVNPVTLARRPFGLHRLHPWLSDLRSMVQMLNREIEIPHPTYEISQDQLYRILAGENLPDEWYENQRRRNNPGQVRLCFECTKALHNRMRAERDIPKDELLVLTDME